MPRIALPRDSWIRRAMRGIGTFFAAIIKKIKPAARAGPGSSTVTPFYTLHPVFFPFLSRNFFPAAAFPLLLQLGPFLERSIGCPF